ncbi:MAG TPA: hypothetical protein VMF86_05850 [Stellaceae bacterium]|nr:hypothetical protein [Stellaceae bacterium]
MTAMLLGGVAAADDVTFQADNWTAECQIGGQPRAIDGDCSVTGVFRDTDADSAAGAFALLVALNPPAVAIVGRPPPREARLRIDAGQAFGCTGGRYCIFSGADTQEIMRELRRGSLILVDIATAQHAYRASLSTRGLQAGLAKIRAEAD